jgi:hypothetical protein
MPYRLLLVSVVLVACTVPASAGIFKKTPKPNPKERVPELLMIVKTDKDEANRAAAAEELREYDAKAFPDLVPVLIDVLMTDSKPGVRTEAAQSLGKIRPISNEAGWALEQAAAKDASMRVRLQARSSLLQYHWAGYRSPKDGAPPESKEPPLATTPPPAPSPQPSIRSTNQRLSPIPPIVTTTTRPSPTGPQLIPTTEPPMLQPLPSSPPPDIEGPSLEPPSK